MARLKLILAYMGTRFSGWQIQNVRHGESPRTIQAEVMKAVSRVANEPVKVHGASRTDAGVHAMGHVCHCDIPDHKIDTDWMRALNSLLPSAISVVSVERVEDDFHSQFHAHGKIYTYSLWLTRRYVLPQRRAFVWQTGPLDLEAMDRAAGHLTGTHDFASFRNVGTDTETSVRTLWEISRSFASPPPGAEGPEALEVVWSFRGNGFLKQMVRNLMGCLVEVGRGKLDPDAVKGILAARDRSAAPVTAPPQGLTLQRIFYEPLDGEGKPLS